jgi:hypothetical protein
MRTRYILFIIFSLVITRITNAQDYVPFKDSLTFKWGVKNTKTGEVTAEAVHPELFDFQDTLFLFSTYDRKFGAINEKGRIVVPISSYETYFMRSDKDNCNKLVEVAGSDIYGKDSFRRYIIDTNRNCLPTDYYPCPYWKKMKCDSLNPSLKLIQEGERVREKNDIDSAIFFCKKAIDISPQNASLYFWGANLFIYNWQDQINSKNNKIYTNYFSWIDDCLKKALELENRELYRHMILRSQYQFYKNSLKDKERASKIKKEVKSANEKLKKNICPNHGKYYS